jgi:hypothetical protein
MTNDDYKSRLTFSYLVGVQSHIDKGISTLDGLIPMFAQILEPLSGNIFNPAQIAADFTLVYGSKIHPYAITSISKKLFEAGYLTETGKDQRSNSIIYTISPSIIVESNIAESQVDTLFLSFREFANNQTEIHGLARFESDELDHAFISRLQSFPLPDQRIWKNQIGEKKSSSNTLSLSKSAKLSDAMIEGERKVQWLNAIFSDYVLNKVNSSYEEYNLFQKIATGSIVVEAVLNFCGPKSENNLQNTWFIFDTPLLMDLLDLDSPERHVFAKEMLKQLVTAKAKLAVFSHSLVETSNNIKAALGAYTERNSHGAIGIRMISSFDFVRRIAAVNLNLKEEVKNLGFSIFDAPSSNNALAFLSTDMENQLSNNIGYYNKDAARLRDASSIAAVVRMRANHKSARKDFSSTKYIFVTRNARLAYLSENYFLAQKVYKDDEMPAVVTDSSLAAILWLMFGSSETSNLPYTRLLANCTSIPQTDEHVRERALKLISNDNSELSKSFQVWSRTPRGAEVMLRKSLGDPNLVTLDNISDFIEEVKDAAGSEATLAMKLEMEAEVKKLIEEHEKINAEHEAEKNTIRNHLENNINELGKVKGQLEKNEIDHIESLAQINNRFEKLESDLSLAFNERENDKYKILISLVNSFKSIQRKWDIRFAVLAGFTAVAIAISAFAFDKFYTISAFWDTKVMILLFVLSGVPVVCAFGSIPVFLLQGFINRKKRDFLVAQLLLINEVSLLDEYLIDYSENKAVKK